MFNKIKDKAWNEGSEWGYDTFAFTVETMILMGKSLDDAYAITKDIYTNKKKVQTRLDAWKEYCV
jgi:hypothetical protein